MANGIVQQDIAGLLDGWIEAERSGVEFPVPFDAAWRIAGYSTKASAKRYVKDVDPDHVSTQTLNKESSNVSGVTRFEHITLSVDGFSDFCLLSKTNEGRLIRKYFIESEKKWRLVQEFAPQTAHEIEMLKIKRDIATQEAIAAVAQEKALALRHWASTALEPADRDRVLGVTTIKEVEYRTKVVDEAGFILNAGETVSKTALAQRYGFVTKTGNADTKTVTRLIEQAIESGAIESPWRDVRVVASAGFDAALVPVLDRFFEATPAQRQRWIGE